MSSDDADRTRNDSTPQKAPAEEERRLEDLVSQVTPRSSPKDADSEEDPNVTRPSGSTNDADDLISLGSAPNPGDADTADAVDEQTIVSGPQVSNPDLDTDNYVPSELGPSAELDSKETTRFGPSIAEKQARREFRKAHREKWKEIGRFKVEKELGAGAFGKVFLAQDKQLDRPVAIKVAKAGALHSREDKERFLREARAAANLRHPHIVPVYEFGEHEGTNYIAYEFIKGRTLRHVLREEPRMKADEAADLMIKIASALDYAHENGIVHRDVKPENILIDESRQPHVADFGCARQDDTNVLLTLEGAVMGTPAYMSPEQASGASHRADRRSDVWSLGVMLNELLTGERPFKGNITEILLSIRSSEPRPIRQFDSTLSKDLETIVQRCMAKEPKERFQTAGELVDELERWQRGEPIVSRPLNVLARTWRWAKRNPQVASLVSIVVITTALGFTISTYQWRRAVRQQKETVLHTVDKLDKADSQEFPPLVQQLESGLNQKAVVDRLRTLWRDKAAVPRSHSRFGAALLALRPSESDDEMLIQLRDYMLSADVDPSEFKALSTVLTGQSEAFLNAGNHDAWAAATDAENRPSSYRLRAYAILAAFDATAPEWETSSDDAIELVLQDPDRHAWLDQLTPVREQLLEDLVRRFKSGGYQGDAADAIARLFSDRPRLLVDLSSVAEENQLRSLVGAMNVGAVAELDTRLGELALPTPTGTADYGAAVYRVASARANLLLAKLALAIREGTEQNVADVWEELGNDQRPDVRTLLIDRFHNAGIDSQAVLSMLTQSHSVERSSQAQAMLLGLGQYPLVNAQRLKYQQTIADFALQHPDSGVHSAAMWLLRSWDLEQDVVNIEEAQWRTSPEGMTLITFGPIDDFAMGATAEEQQRFYISDQETEPRHRRRIARRFEISSREVTAGEYLRFLNAYFPILKSAAESAEDKEQREELELRLDAFRSARAQIERQRAELPVTEISWRDATAYCRWLSEQHGVEEDQQCYLPLQEHAQRLADLPSYAKSVTEANIVRKTGFRLPTSGEWEFVCRGEALSVWPHGDYHNLLDQYAWFGQPRLSELRPPGSLKPNRFGMHDMLGNASEWCHCLMQKYPEGEKIDDPYVGSDARGREAREVRGGHTFVLFDQARPAARKEVWLDEVSDARGFRVARTVEIVE